MLRFRLEHLILISTIIITVLIASSPALFAQETVKIGGELDLVRTERQSMTIDDTEEHILAVDKAIGTNTDTGDNEFMDDAIVTAYSLADIVSGNGPINGYVKLEDKDGFVYLKHSHMAKTTLTGDGKPMLTFNGSFHFVSGMGKYLGIEGTGTYEGEYTSEYTIKVVWDGEYSIEREVALEQR